MNVLNTVPEGSVVDYTSLEESKLVHKSKCAARACPK